MKKLIIHFIPVVISGIWLIAEYQTLNPITLKGPDFLKFYLILVLGFYGSIFIVKSVGGRVSPTTFYFLMGIGCLGIVKLIRGIMLGKPIGFLAMILIAELIIAFLLMSWTSNDKLKQ
ncbi:DUF2207 domain-containing protein [Chryseobacterium jejuense]|uniref:DoxX n=1 Tax=Chryseobacterium jejuense TaxID=445960 RepID=A0A2X2X9N1_CHRJE|nr:hypothetical protein [Chryseobacterium jejuense]SDI66664.1 hypothetical protein SAMN05421542_1663 [Chryseobacterium jejuense]SQB47391.1 Uncharacterised protein [Chryseobacterium jejuense]